MKNVVEPKAKRFTKRYEELYLKRREINKLIELAEQRVHDLKHGRKEVDKVLANAFADTDRLRLADGTVIIRKVITVDPLLVTASMKIGDTLREGYSFVKYREKDGLK